jgi:selenide,water dikinase
MSTPRLTATAKAAGCAAKLSPKILDQVLAQVPRFADPNVLVGFDGADDAGVYLIAPGLAMVQTVDFFTPIVDDPETFGAIAAANAISDVYAMGGRPVSALSILACPSGDALDVVAGIVRGGALKLAEAGVAVLGGHSIVDDDIKFGYAVTGLIDPDCVKTNGGARPGDDLVFTKRLGTGVISTALKRGFAREEHMEESIASMLELNRVACETMLRFDVHACTDVTGFGLLGHSREMALGSGVTLEIETASLPFLPGALDYARQGALSGGLKNNREFALSCVEYTRDIAPEVDDLLYDPQTSGGLLIALLPSEAESFLRDYPKARRIGRVSERGTKPLRII